MKYRWLIGSALSAAVILATAFGQSTREEQRASAVEFGDWRDDSPGVRHKIGVEDMPPPFATSLAAKQSEIAPLPSDARPNAPDGFKVRMLAHDFNGPRTMRVAPNGDIFLAESDAGRIRALRLSESGDKLAINEVFAEGLDAPYGIAFYPPGPNPRYLYVATESQVLRYPYGIGALKPSGEREKIAALPPGGGHWTRDIAFSPDGAMLYVAVGSKTNVAEGLSARALSQNQAEEKTGVVGEMGGAEKGRAQVLALDPDGRNGRVFATGLRNCSGLAIRPSSKEVWCAVNERDMLGDDLPPDYVTKVKEGAFYGWPWYYIGPHPDPRHAGERTDLAGKVTTPDVLIQPHSAPLGVVFYDGSQFPPAYQGDAFVALHGSWNRSKLTGYKIVRLRFANGEPTGEYDDFITGFVLDDGHVWGRPVGVAVAKDGSLLFSEDGAGSIWRVSFAGK